MSIPDRIAQLTGHWAGPSKLWLSPDAPARESASTAVVKLAAKGRCLVVEYTWAFEGEEQEGLLVLGPGGEPGSVAGSWVDSWHMSDAFMALAGGIEDGARISVLGSYAAPPGPDWGWRVAIEPGAETFKLLMYNISPEGAEAPAVEAVYAAQPGQ
jgi:hypothetical protein